jgi:hypothetical protein
MAADINNVAFATWHPHLEYAWPDPAIGRTPRSLIAQETNRYYQQIDIDTMLATVAHCNMGRKTAESSAPCRTTAPQGTS